MYNLFMQTTTQFIDARLNRAGQLRAFIVGTRVRVLDIYAMAELQGLSPDEIVYALPHLTLAQVHSALAYYFANRDEMVRQLREEEELAQQLHSSTGPGPLESRFPGRDSYRGPVSP